jgi:hypothetical protein
MDMASAGKPARDCRVAFAADPGTVHFAAQINASLPPGVPVSPRRLVASPTP